MNFQSLPTEWSFDLSIVIPLLIVALLYALGIRYALRVGLIRRAQPWRIAAFVGALVTLEVALQSPVDAWADIYLWAHMAQHLLLIFVAAPLLLLGAPIWPLWRSIPLPARRASMRWLMRQPGPRRAAFALNHTLTTPRVVWALFVVNFTIWHVPALYDLALRYQTIHDVEHGLFLLTALLFWAQVIPSMPLKPRLTYLWQMLYTFSAGLALSAVSMVYVYDPTPIYPYYAAVHRAPGMITALVDQGGAAELMNAAGAILFGTLFMVLMALWLEADERIATQEEARRALPTAQ